jgi:glycosyltransferase involved in cell wall biosynthesis
VTLDVVLCTHNPRRDVLSLAIRSLARQTAGPGAFRLVLVDNASEPPLEEELLAPVRAAGIEAVLTREPRPGLTQARLHAIHQTGARWMLFVDDDNELADDFVAQGLAFAAERPDVGCFGGRLVMPETIPVPGWARPFLPWLGIKDAGDETITGSGDSWGPWEPPGAGHWIRRDQLEAYRSRIEDDPRSLELGRKGRSGLASCEDSLMARQSARLGLLNAYVPRLSLRHHLDPRRFRLRYLVRLLWAYGASHALLESVLARDRGAPLVTPSYYRDRKAFRGVLRHEWATARRESLAYGVAKVAYHVSARRSWLRLEGEGGAA